MTTTTDLNPVATDPQTGYNTYELLDPSGKTRKVNLWAASSFMADNRGRLALDESMVSNLERRMRVLYDRYQGRELDPNFAMDMIASDLSDEEMVRLYDQRFAFFDRPTDQGFWGAMRWTVTNPWEAVKRDVLRPIGKGLDVITPGNLGFEEAYGDPLKGVVQAFDKAYDVTMNNLARSITGDEEMTWHGLLSTGVMTGVNLAKGESIEEQRQRLGFDPETHTFRDPKSGEQIGVQQWFDTQAPGWLKATNFAAQLVDPFVFMAAARTARLGARTIRASGATARTARVGGFAATREFMSGIKSKGVWGAFKSSRQARAARSVESFASRRFGQWGTTVEDFERISTGELKWGDYLKGVNLREIAATKMFPSLDDIPTIARDFGFEPKTWRYFQEAAMTGNVEHLRVLAPKAPGSWLMAQQDIIQEGHKLGKTTKEIAEDLRQAHINLFDPETHEVMDRTILEAEKKWSSAKDELDQIENSFFDPLEQGEWPLSDAERIEVLNGQPHKARAFTDAAKRERTNRQDLLKMRQTQGSLTQVIDTIPRHGMSAAMRRWVEHASGVENVGELGTSESILDRISHKGARSLKNVMTYAPHRAIDVTDDFSHQQYRRLLDNVELDIGPRWTKGDTAGYYDKYLRAADDGERFALMEQLADDVYTRLGFTGKQIDRIKTEYKQFWGDLGDKLSITAPRNLTVMDPHLIRRLARLGPKALEPNTVKDLMEKSLRLWKRLAITRPAWAFRVVGLSEQPRAAMAGMPNLVTHPLIWMATAQIPGVQKGAQAVLGARLKLPGWKSRLTLNYGMMDDLLRESDMGVALSRSQKAATRARLNKELGSLGLNGQPTTTQVFHLEDAVTDADKTAYVKGWAEILNTRLPKDELHVAFLNGATLNDAKTWANSEQATAWRNKHGLAAGSKELVSTLKQERKFFDALTLGDSEIISHIRSGKKYHWKDLVDLKAPDRLPLDVFTGRLDRPGLAMSRTTTQKIMQPIFDSMSSTPSFWASRFPAYRIAGTEAATKYTMLYAGRGSQAVEYTADAWRQAVQGQDLARLRREALDLLSPEERKLWIEHVSEGRNYHPQMRTRFAEAIESNAEWRELNQTLLEEMGVPERVVGWRVRSKTGASLGSGDVVNFSLTEGGARSVNTTYHQGEGVVETFSVSRKDIIGFGAGGTEAEFMVWRRDILPTKRAGLDNPTESLKKITAHLNGKPVELNALERRIADWSHQTASSRVRQVFYDLNESSRVADLARFMAPFGNAWQEELTRWAALSWERPLVPAGLMTAWRAKEDLPFSYTDPRSGDEMFSIPLSQNIVRFATGRWNPWTRAPAGIAMPLTGRWKNLNILTGSGWLPGAGPFLTLPAKALARAPGGLGHVFQGLHATIDPYGAGKGITLTDILPSPFLRGAKQLEDDPAADAALAHAVVVHTFERTNGRITPEDEATMEEQLRGLKMVNFAASLSVGSGIKVGLAPKLREMVDFMKWAQHSFGNSAQNIFLDRYGDEAAAYMVNLSRSMTGAPATAEAEEMLLSPENKKWGKSKAFWAVMAEKARGEWDPIASAAQVRRGDREARGVHELTKTAYTVTGWYRYGIEKQKYVDALERAGLNTRSQGPTADAYKAIFEKKRQSIFDAYPGFQAEFEAVDYNAWRQNMRDLRVLVDDPVAADLQTTKGAKAFFTEIEKIATVLRANDISSLSNKKAEGVRRIFNQKLDQLFRQYPDFRLVYYRLGLDAFDAREGDMPSAAQRSQ